MKTYSTLQEAFSESVTAVIKQGKKSADGLAHCKYRGPNGLKCALGHLIPDELYEPELEGVTPMSARAPGSHPRLQKKLSSVFEALGLGADDSAMMLRMLQFAHDYAEDSRFVESFIERATRVAKKLSLEMPVT